MRTFISSTYEDLKTHRDSVANAVERLGHQGIRMEVFGARPEQATNACLGEIDSCDTFIGVYAHRYGFVPEGSGLSITEQELDHALQIKLPVFCYVVDEEFPWVPKHIDIEPARSKLIALKQRISKTLVRDTFTTAHDLGFKVAATLGRFLTTQRIKEELKNVQPAQTALSKYGMEQVARRAIRVFEVIRGSKVLLVNDNPTEMMIPIRILEELEVDVAISQSTEEAMSRLSKGKIDVVVSDMMRGANERAGLDLLKQMHGSGVLVPVIFTVGRFRAEFGTPGGAFGITNRVDELLNLLFDALERVRG